MPPLDRPFDSAAIGSSAFTACATVSKKVGLTLLGSLGSTVHHDESTEPEG